MQYDVSRRDFDKKVVLWGLVDDPTTPNPEDWKRSTVSDETSYYPKRWVPLKIFDYSLEIVERKKR